MATTVAATMVGFAGIAVIMIAIATSSAPSLTINMVLTGIIGGTKKLIEGTQRDRQALIAMRPASP